MIRRLGLVCLGGCAGGAARIGLDGIAPDTLAIPVTLLLINVAGSFLIAIVATRLGAHRTWWPLLGPGFMGGFTTFSAIAALSWVADAGNVLSIAVLTATLIVCTAVAVLGLRTTGGVRRAAS